MRSHSFPRVRHLLTVFFLLLAGQLVVGVLLIGALWATGEGAAAESVQDWSMPLVYLFGSLPAVAYARWRAGRPSVSFDPGAIPKRMLLGCTLAFIVFGFGVGCLGGYLPTADLIPAAGSSLSTGVGTFLTLALLAPLVEEYLFRGILLERMLRLRSPRTSILLTSLTFGLSHLVPAHVVTATLMGVALGYLYYRTRSFALVVILHAVNNTLAYAAGTFLEETEMMGELSLPLGVAVGMFAIGLGALSLYRMVPRRTGVATVRAD
ncbi:CPBP family intramembrane glutamic endopeptidase [Lewinella sp. JB7]|uniref:CPBP family intramembrane glutamic endopeptidase n=1 Tax=Lewinella sp. JB7 TaxID=2962887 RepID=UPI0020C9CB20|nr:type II CAAX endopeptidase family protein [Lewinella sp. JB7]MCP9237320.1 CPBP family intramembrane metalloprotease [Lewinella sp. JB7]